MDIIDELEKHKRKVFENIGSESIQAYLFLQREYRNGEGRNDPLFRFVYRSFYRLDNAGLTSEWKQRYFALLEEKVLNLEEVLRELYTIPTRRGKSSVQFSFATKMLHTISPVLPIYDSIVGKVLGISITGRGEEKIKSCVKAYQKLRDKHDELLKDSRVGTIIEDFKAEFDAGDLSDTKALDFLLWGLGKVKA